MSEREFENYLTLLASLLRLSAEQRESVADELRDHLEERVAHLMAQGVARDEAMRRAIAEFGDAARLAEELSQIAQLKRRRWIMRMTAGSLTAAALVAFAALAFWPATEEGPAPEVAIAQDNAEDVSDQAVQQQTIRTKSRGYNLGRSKRDLATKRKLQNTITSWEFEEIPLTEVAELLSDESGVQILFDILALDDAGISTDTPVTCNLKDLPVSILLDLVLRDLELTYIIHEGVVMVTTHEEAEVNLDTRVYDVSDIVATQTNVGTMDPQSIVKALQPKLKELIDALDTSENPELALRQAIAAATRMQNSVDNLGKWNSAKDRAFTDLTELLFGTVQPDVWEKVGGPCSIRQYRDYLVISATENVHREVETTLENLRGVMAQQPHQTAQP